MDIKCRKDDHIGIALDHNIQVSYDHWDDVGIVHEAIPSCDMDEIDLSVNLLGKKLKAPLIISSMTGGSRRAKKINNVLARAASEFGLAMGVGSQRVALEKGEHVDSYSVVKEFDIPLVFGNIGAPQFSNGAISETYDINKVLESKKMIDADAVFIHLNYLQEIVQPEGETHVKGMVDNIRSIAKEVDIVAKETGAGISKNCALTLKEIGVKVIDVAGASGTSFAAVESYRGTGESPSRIGRTHWNWGIPTPVSLITANVGIPLIGSGGIRNGLDIVKALVMGASVSGMAWHLLENASMGYDEVKKEIEAVLSEIKAGLFLSGVNSARNAGSATHYVTGITRDILEQIRN